MLRLFRVHKDPTILAPQFLPLFNRILFIDEPQQQSRRELAMKTVELLAFVAELEMGAFYTKRLHALLGEQHYLDAAMQPETFDEAIAPPAERAARIEEHRTRIAAAREHVHELIVELLRYQPWRASAQKSHCGSSQQ